MEEDKSLPVLPVLGIGAGILHEEQFISLKNRQMYSCGHSDEIEKKKLTDL